MMKTAAHIFLLLGAHPFTPTGDYSGLIGRLGLLISAKNTVIREIDLTLHSSGKHPRDSAIASLSGEHVCVRVSSFMCAEKYLMVQKSAFVSVGHFVRRGCVCFWWIITQHGSPWESLFLREILYLATFFGTHFLKYSQIDYSRTNIQMLHEATFECS